MILRPPAGGAARSGAITRAAVLFAVAGVLFFASRWLFAAPRQASLLGRARVLVPGAVRKPLPSGGFAATGSSLALNLETFNYAWKDDATLLLWDDDPTGRGWRLMEMPIATGTAARPLDAFNHRLKRLGGKRSLSAEWQLSPDGLWVVWPNYQDDKKGWPQRVSWTLAALDGSRAARVIRLGLPPPSVPNLNTVFASWVWRPDSTGWTVLFSDPLTLSLRSFDRTAPPKAAFRDIPLGSAAGNPATFPTPHPRDLLGFTGDDQAVSALCTAGSTTIFLFPVHAPPAAVRRFGVTLPPGTEADAAALSPNGKYVAWSLYREHALPTLIDRLLFWVKRQPRVSPQAGLYGTARDGTNSRLLGWTKAARRTPNGPGDSDTRLKFLRWTPDGSRLSFVSDGTLYVLPASEKR